MVSTYISSDRGDRSLVSSILSIFLVSMIYYGSRDAICTVVTLVAICFSKEDRGSGPYHCSATGGILSRIFLCFQVYDNVL